MYIKTRHILLLWRDYFNAVKIVNKQFVRYDAAIPKHFDNFCNISDARPGIKQQGGHLAYYQIRNYFLKVMRFHYRKNIVGKRLYQKPRVIDDF